jgi:hypothetical protein
MANVRDDVRERRAQEFLAVFARTGDPVKAAEDSGHPALRALETLRDHGFILTAPVEREAA